MRANADAAASRSRSPSFASTVGVTRYEELYKRKILRELTAGGDASDAEDESFTDDEFFDCDDPSVLGEAGLELRALERRLTLEELLAARERAELSVYRDEEKDAFLDAEEEIDSDESSERATRRRNPGGVTSPGRRGRCTVGAGAPCPVSSASRPRRRRRRRASSRLLYLRTRLTTPPPPAPPPSPSSHDSCP